MESRFQFLTLIKEFTNYLQIIYSYEIEVNPNRIEIIEREAITLLIEIILSPLHIFLQK